MLEYTPQRVHALRTCCLIFVEMYSKTCLKRPLKKDQKLAFKTDYSLMQVKSIAERSKRAFCNTFDLHKLPFVVKTFVLSFLSCRFRQVLLYIALGVFFVEIVSLAKVIPQHCFR